MSQDLRLTTIRHTHGDHIGINRDLKSRGQLATMRVVGAEKRKDDIPGVNELVPDGSQVLFGESAGTTMLTEGHIDGHVHIYFGNFILWSTLFAGGCGYLFDGPIKDKRFDSLVKLPKKLSCSALTNTRKII